MACSAQPHPIGAAVNLLRNVLICLLLACAMQATAQHSGGDPRPATSAAPEARQFDFMIGQWELEVRPKISSIAAMIHGAPKLVGTWKAWRAFDGFGIDDEVRIVDASGNPVSLSHAMRVFSASESRWSATTLDVYRGRVAVSSGAMQGRDMVMNGSGTDAEGKPTLTRARYTDIAPDAFRVQQDRSSDNGQTWDEAVLVIAAKRVSASAPR